MHRAASRLFHGLTASRPTLAASAPAFALRRAYAEHGLAPLCAGLSLRFQSSSSNSSAAAPTPPPRKHDGGDSPSTTLKQAAGQIKLGYQAHKALNEPPPPSTPVDVPPSVSFFSSPWGWWRANAARFKLAVTSYSYFAVATYLGIYVVTLAGLFLLVQLGFVKGPDVNAFLNGWFVKRAIYGDQEVKVPPTYLNFATAWVLTKMTEPLRLMATLALLPSLARRAPAGLLRAFRVPEAVIAKRLR